MKQILVEGLGRLTHGALAHRGKVLDALIWLNRRLVALAAITIEFLYTGVVELIDMGLKKREEEQQERRKKSLSWENNAPRKTGSLRR